LAAKFVNRIAFRTLFMNIWR